MGTGRDTLVGMGHSKLPVSNCSITHRIHQTPSDFYLFLKLKEFVKGQKSVDDEDVIHTASGWMEDRDQDFFYSGIRT